MDENEEENEKNDGKSIKFDDFVKLFDFDNDGKITPSDIIIYFENLEKDSVKVLRETKKYFNKERKINKDDYILELEGF